MVSFWIYDVTFLILFSIGIWLFLSRRKEELSREGWMFIWRTQFGVKIIDSFAKRFGWILKKMKWTIISVGFLLMGIMVWMLGKTAFIYVLHPEITKVLRAPPIAPLIPYFPKLFGMESFFPPFYFTYFIVALAIVAIAHEFSHGIFMRLFKIKIKSTGLVFLGPMLGAFVEQDEKSMNKKKKLDQMTVLGAGVFANILLAFLFYLLYVLFFFTSFTASGYSFNSYGAYEVPLNSIDSVGEDLGAMNIFISGKFTYTNISEAVIGNKTYLMSTDVKNFWLKGVGTENRSTIVLEKAPAVLSGIKGAIVEADGEKISNHEDLRWFLENKKPGDIVEFITESDGERSEYDLMLAEHPDGSGRAYVGIGNSVVEPSGFIQKFLKKFMSFKDDTTYYKPIWGSDFVYFFYYLFWWIMVINLLVALFNMMPLGMLDGGKLFYLGVWGIFGSEKWAARAYKFATYFILMMFVLMMLFWFIGLW